MKSTSEHSFHGYTFDANECWHLLLQCDEIVCSICSIASKFLAHDIQVLTSVICGTEVCTKKNACIPPNRSVDGTKP